MRPCGAPGRTNRCANWLVGNMDLLNAIRAGYSYYEAYARLYKGWQGAPGTLKRASLPKTSVIMNTANHE